MDSRSTRRPITFDPSSICSIESAGTMRRRRASQPERTESASGSSGEVPYIGHSTVPTTRPLASATRKPAVLRRSIARALIVVNLFPEYEETPPIAVKDLLAPFAAHRQQGDREQHEVNGREHGDDTACDRLPGPQPPEAAAEGHEEEEEPDVGGEEAEADPGRVLGVILPVEDHLGEDAKDDVGRDPDEERTERRAAQERRIGALP